MAKNEVRTTCKCGCRQWVHCPPDAVPVAYKSVSHARRALAEQRKRT